MKYSIAVTQKQIDKALEWKRLSDKHNLNLEELRELTYHIDQIRKIMNKGK